ncbi:PqiC family protein [Brevirhabdus sp.]|uniref:PqiC family protein n=1 Tax=Brevirhabdus sp. TaxID=2004514 RepID=UPI0040588F2A
MTRFLTLPALLLLTACGSDPILRYAVPQTAVAERVKVGVRSVEVREVTLPTYAALEEIYVETPEGALASDAVLLWADDPTRAVTLALARDLGEITGARAATEPWPFEELADVRLEVRVDEMVAGRGNIFRFSGQYFVASPDGRRDRSGGFKLTAPFAPEAGAAGIAAARGQVVQSLARQIAREALR